MKTSKGIDERSIKRYERLNKCSVYSPGETVLLRLGEKRSKSRKNIRILEGKVIKKSKTLDRYVVQFNHAKEKQPSKIWFSVEDMVDYINNNAAAEKNKTTKLQNLRKELLIPLTREDRLDAITNQGYAIIYDPPGNGDYQFAALTYLLQRIGVHRSPSTLRAKVVRKWFGSWKQTAEITKAGLWNCLWQHLGVLIYNK